MLCKKRCSEKVWKFHRKIPLLGSLDLPCKYYWVLAIVEYFYTNQRKLCFYFVLISSIESAERSPTSTFFFFHIFTSYSSIFSGFCVRQCHLMLCCFYVNKIKLFSKTVNIDCCTNKYKS